MPGPVAEICCTLSDRLTAVIGDVGASVFMGIAVHLTENGYDMAAILAVMIALMLFLLPIMKLMRAPKQGSLLQYANDYTGIVTTLAAAGLVCATVHFGESGGLENLAKTLGFGFASLITSIVSVFNIVLANPECYAALDDTAFNFA